MDTNVQCEGKNDLEQIIWSRVKKLDKRIRIVLLSSLIWGIFAHGMALFNKYSMHSDSRYLFDVGVTFTSGRWMLAELGKLYRKLFGSTVYSLPLFNGIFSILYIAAASYLIIRLLNMKQKGSCIAVTGILITFPVVTAILGYTYTAPYYMLSLLLAVSGMWVANRKANIFHFLVGALLLSFSLGIYQSFLPVMLSLALLCFIYRLATDNSDTPKALMLSGVYLLGTVVSGVLFYFLLNKCFLAYNHLELSDYRSIDTMGREPLGTYLVRVLEAIRRFFVTDDFNVYTSMFPFRIRHLYLLALLFTGLLSLRMIILTFRKNIFRGIFLTISVLLLPIAFNFIFIMCAFEDIHTLMLYGQSMLFVYLVWLIEFSEFSKINITRAVYGFGTSLMLFISFSYSRYANINYLKAEYQQQRMISYFTVLITQIKSTEGYRDELPVVYINPREKKDLTIKELPAFDRFLALPYNGIENDLNEYAWIRFMNNWCAFSPELADEEDFKDLNEVIEMPYYPDDGSIQIINDTVVVKFGSVEE